MILRFSFIGNNAWSEILLILESVELRTPLFVECWMKNMIFDSHCEKCLPTEKNLQFIGLKTMVCSYFECVWWTRRKKCRCKHFALCSEAGDMRTRKYGRGRDRMDPHRAHHFCWFGKAKRFPPTATLSRSQNAIQCVPLKFCFLHFNAQHWHKLFASSDMHTFIFGVLYVCFVWLGMFYACCCWFLRLRPFEARLENKRPPALFIWLANECDPVIPWNSLPPPLSLSVDLGGALT